MLLNKEKLKKKKNTSCLQLRWTGRKILIQLNLKDSRTSVKASITCLNTSQTRHWSIHSMISLGQPFGWVLSSRLLTWIIFAQIKSTTSEGNLNIIIFLLFTLPLGSCVCTIWLVFSLCFPTVSPQCTAAHTALRMHSQGSLAQAWIKENSTEDFLQIHWCKKNSCYMT